MFLVTRVPATSIVTLVLRIYQRRPEPLPPLLLDTFRRAASRRRRVRRASVDTIDVTRRANDDVDNDDDGPPPALERVSTTRSV